MDGEFFKSLPELEAKLLREHRSDGTHPVASTGQSGFMSAEDKKKLDELWVFMKAQQRGG